MCSVRPCHLFDTLETMGAQMDGVDDHGATPLHYAAQFRPPEPTDDASDEHLDTATGELNNESSRTMMEKMLARTGTEVDCRDEEGRTPLMWASSSGGYPSF